MVRALHENDNDKNACFTSKLQDTSALENQLHVPHPQGPFLKNYKLIPGDFGPVDLLESLRFLN